ncbi:DUF4097 family beta strand repeat protein [bacterium]|nr:DUF4097 family beta strand repeat protein [bacterium]
MIFKEISKSLIIFCLLCLSAGVYGEEVSKEEVKTIPLNPGGSVILKANEGDVVVNTWSKPQIRIKMVKRAWGRNKKEALRNLKKIYVDINSFGDRVIIKEKNRRESSVFHLFEINFHRYGWRVDFELTVPKETNVKIESDEGGVKISDVEGEIMVKTDEGDVNLEQIVSNSIQLQADEGSIDCSDIKSNSTGYFKADADEGDFTLYNSQLHEIDVRCDEGRITIEKTSVAKFWLNCDEGDVSVSFIPSDNGQYEIETDEGDIDIGITEESNLKVILRSADGRIRNDFNLPKSKVDDGESLRGVIGKERAVLRARSDEGDIRLFKNN